MEKLNPKNKDKDILNLKILSIALLLLFGFVSIYGSQYVYFEKLKFEKKILAKTPEYKKERIGKQHCHLIFEFKDNSIYKMQSLYANFTNPEKINSLKENDTILIGFESQDDILFISSQGTELTNINHLNEFNSFFLFLTILIIAPGLLIGLFSIFNKNISETYALIASILQLVVSFLATIYSESIYEIKWI
jgi:hypothetical protein